MLVGFGGGLISLGTVRPMYRYLAGESSDAVEIASDAVARGLAKGGLQAGTAEPAPPSAVVKVKCRNCGYLDSDDATYCSKCGEPL